ncbi:hypothetical protein [Streptomyces sp. AK02-04a]|uniref:hypothetical protein n=1 Tax=Streptomyces sp. AK02-04a TaxID=3028649 RepID=UPI0029ACEEB6|nr:hypothetical protein [Streptomyces sp. AK02-04a]MDX3763417.1 hypothetical protein [Streptomyces sp. AK02-04a]
MDGHSGTALSATFRGEYVGSAVSFEELGGLFGEELPARTVLSTVMAPGGDQGTYPMLIKKDGSTTVAFACQYHENAASPNLLTMLGLASTPPSYSMVCMPATIVTHS